jgi:Tfp pilus assembly major pilin PilA
MATALTTGVITAIVTALLVAAVSTAIHITVYQCVYKQKLMIRNASTSHEPNVMYEVVDRRPRVGAALEMKENEAYSVNKRVGGPEMKQNEAYGVAKPRITKSSCST